MPAYAALYRTWRPRRLADVAGQEHVTRTLLHALRQGHPAHAYLFCGPRGTGKTSTARILAAALNCERPEGGDACGSCAQCEAVAHDRLLDVQEIDAASHRQVDDVRALRDRVGYAPAAGRHKVYILDEVHMLTEASWNTLLKTLEEPPPNTTFILCTTDPRKVLGTVVSRCQRFDFRRLTGEEIERRLREVCGAEGIAAAPEALRSVARRADGSLRDALAILDQLTAYVAEAAEITAQDVAAVTGSADEDAVAALLDAAAAGDAPAIFRGVERLYADGKDMAQVCRDLAAALRDQLAAGGAPDIAWTLRAIGVLAEADGQMRRWAQPRLVLEVALLQLMPAAAAPPVLKDHTPVRATVTAEATSAPLPRESRAVWEDLLREVRGENAPVAAILAEGVPELGAPGVLRVRFPSATQAELAARHGARLAALAQRLAGAPLRMEFLPSGPAAPPRAPGPGTAPPRPSTRGAGETAAGRQADAAFRRALSLFEGTAVDGDAT